MMKVILVLNTGSSSVKFSVFSVGDGGLLPLFRGEFEGIGTAPHFFATEGRHDRRGCALLRGRSRDAGRRGTPHLRLAEGPRCGTGDHGGRSSRGAWRAGLRRAGGGR